MSTTGQGQFAVVVNDEEQYSVWRMSRPVPDGWRTTGYHGTRDECLDHIEKVWVDITPRSVRLSLERARAEQAAAPSPATPAVGGQ